MNGDYIIRRAETSEDGKLLNELFTEVFHPEEVGVLAETIFNHLPRMKKKYWFIAEDKKSSTIASAFALIPWRWDMEGVPLKVAEMGIVGTREAHRGKGLMRLLNKEFDRTLMEETFDLSVIQGIPGFYHNFGFYYSVAMENHIDLPLHLIPDRPENERCAFRLAGPDDIPILMEADAIYGRSFFITTQRDEANWRYLLNESQKTEYGSEFWLVENREMKETYYCRIPREGFGQGLILSEISENISHDALLELLVFCKGMAGRRNKPYIRLNLHNESGAGRIAISMGAEKSKPYAWQVKFPDRIRFLEKMAPILERRMENSCFKNFTGCVRLDLFKTGIDLNWKEGVLESVLPKSEEECENTLCVNQDLFPALCLGHRTWRELQYTRPDIFPWRLYIRPDGFKASDRTGLLTDTLFPRRNSWVYEQY